MLVHAFVATVGAYPEPTVFAVLDSCDEELADFVCCCSLVALFGQDDGSELFFVPIRGSFSLLLLLLFLASVCVEVLLLCLALNGQVVCKLAFATLLTVSLLEEDAYNRFRVNTKGNLLNLHRAVQKFCHFTLRRFSGSLLLLPCQLICLLALFFGASTVLQVRSHLGNLLLRGSTLLVLHTKGSVFHNLGGRRLLAATTLVLLWRHFEVFGRSSISLSWSGLEVYGSVMQILTTLQLEAVD